MNDGELFTMETGLEFMRMSRIAYHAVTHHNVDSRKPVKVGEDWLVCLCTPGCPNHFDITCREKPFRFNGAEWFMQMYGTLWDGSGRLHFGVNGMEIVTAERTYGICVNIM